MNQPVLDMRHTREAYYQSIKSLHMSPLWEAMSALVPERPRSPCVPFLWRYEAARPWLMESGSLITAKEAVRRVLILENPGIPGSSAITQSLYAGWQLILPGEVAPSHRHTQSALRLIVEGRGAYTAVEGERVTMYPGDFIITPSWTWHDHGNDAAEPVVWLDGLDIPIVRFLDCGFAENAAEDSQTVTRPEGDALARYGSNLLPIEYAPPMNGASPVFAYPYARTREALETMSRNGPPHIAHGYKMQYVNPATGGYPMPSIATFVQWLPKGFDGRAYRSTDGSVFSVIEGEGTVSIGEQDFEFTAHDTFVVPAWQSYRLRTAAGSVLFSFSDRPLQRSIGVWREEMV